VLLGVAPLRGLYKSKGIFTAFRPLTGLHTKYSTKYRKNKGLKKLYFILHAERLHDMMQIKETAQDKTVAEFPGANKVTVSQRHETW
jgi:hypothetical protein